VIIDILTGFPEMLDGAVNQSIVRNALICDACRIWIHDLRHYTSERHGKIDDSPYGGGAGMVLAAQPIFACLDKLNPNRAGGPRRIYLSPQGTTLTQSKVEALTSEPWLILLCGHYKDVDARVFERDEWEELSVGDYVTSGGELPAALLTDAIVRRLPGVIGDDESALTDSFADGLLDAPYYTKPEAIEGLTVPEVLISGNHAKIAAWRREQKIARTKLKRPDLWQNFSGSAYFENKKNNE
jgi:tRNA (guanine37-N1)-methyltransferase